MHLINLCWRSMIMAYGAIAVQGIKAGLELKGSPDEQSYLEQFSAHFFVTFTKEKYFKSDRYILAFLKPTEEYKRAFNFANEVLFICTDKPDFNTFQGRLYDFVDKTLAEYSNRLDKICIFVVSQDPNIETIVSSQLLKDKDSRIIIPFSYQELKDKSLNSESLLNKLRKYFYSRDLFAMESPLRTDAYFYGRSSLVQSLYGKYMSGEQSGLFGLRRSGKTSVLLALQRIASLQDNIAIYFDCSSTSVHRKRWNMFLKYIVDNLMAELGLTPPETFGARKFDEDSAGDEFEKTIREIWTRTGKKRILLILDEIESISYRTSSSEHWKNGNDSLFFWQTIRPIIQKDNSLISFIIAGVNPSCVEAPLINEYDNPIFCMLSPQYLPLFSYDSVKDMVESIGGYMGVSFDNEIITDLTDCYGGHPFLIRHICSMINSDTNVERPAKVSKYSYRAHADEYKLRMYSYVASILQVLQSTYENEYKLLKTLAIHGNKEFKKNIYGQENAVIHLLGYGIVQYLNSDYFITISIIQEYLCSKYEYEKKLETPEEVWELVTVRRGKIERIMRTLMLTQLTGQFGKSNVKEKIKECLDDHNKKVLDSMPLSDFVENRLLFSSLKQIYIKNWTQFQNFFDDKNKFMFYADHINQFRVDAHSKNISEDDLALLRVAFNWFDSSLSP